MNARRPIGPPVLPALIVAVAAIAFGQGCAPVNIESGDQQALRTVRRIIVLPVTDAPHAQAGGSGWSARGAIIQGLYELGKYDLISVPPAEIESAASEAGFDIRDCFDPYVAAAVGRRLQADAVVCGELTHWSARQEQDSSSVMGVAGSTTKTFHYVGLSLRIVQTSNAEIIYSGIGDGRSEKGYTSAVETAIDQGMGDLRLFSRSRS